MNALRCPYCGSELYITCEYVGSGYMSENTPASIQCDELVACGAEWETNGDLRTPGRVQP